MKKMNLITSMFLGCCIWTTGFLQAQPSADMSGLMLRSSEARKSFVVAEEKAKSMGYAMAMTAIDPNGEIIATHAMTNGLPIAGYQSLAATWAVYAYDRPLYALSDKEVYDYVQTATPTLSSFMTPAQIKNSSVRPVVAQNGKKIGYFGIALSPVDMAVTSKYPIDKAQEQCLDAAQLAFRK